MRNVLSSGLVAAALGTALIVAGALPASAQGASPQLGLAASNSDSNLLTLVRGGRMGGGGMGGGGGHFAMGGGGGHFAMGGGGGRFAMAGGGRFAGGRFAGGHIGANRFDVAHRNVRFARNDHFHDHFHDRFHRNFRNNAFFFGFGDGGYGYAYDGCVIGYDGLVYCPPY